MIRKLGYAALIAAVCAVLVPAIPASAAPASTVHHGVRYRDATAHDLARLRAQHPDTAQATPQTDTDDQAITACESAPAPAPPAEYAYLDRFTDCTIALGDAYAQVCSDGDCITTSEYLWFIVEVTRTNYLTKTQRVVVQTEPFVQAGTDAAAANAYEIGAKCAGTNGSTCAADGPQSTVRPAGEWYAGARAVTTYTAAGTSGRADNVTDNTMTPFGGTAGKTSELSPDTFRCDDALYIKKVGTSVRVQGCVFPQVTPVLSYSRTVGNATATAAHIYLAQTNPAATKPGYRNTVIPGSPASGQMLHRQIESARTTLNRAAAVTTCLLYWPLYASQRKDCDEYPFATTQEGAAYHSFPGATHKNYSYSAMPIPRGDNRSAGAALGRFYATQRVLNGEGFYVQIT